MSRERNFKSLDQARRIFEARVARAKVAMKNDLETIKATDTERSGHAARSVHLAAIREYDRALLEAFDEYLDATTDVIPDDEEGRRRHAEASHAERAGRAVDLGTGEILS